MNITIPVYIEQSQKKGAPPIFEIRPLFYDSPVGHNEKLSKAMSRTASKIRKTLNLCAQQARHNAHPAPAQASGRMSFPFCFIPWSR